MVEKSVENQFMQWLSYHVSSAQYSELLAAFAGIESFCIEHGILKMPLFQTTDLRTLSTIRRIVDLNIAFRLSIKKGQMSKMSSAIRYYISFVKENAEQLDVSSDSTTGDLHPEIKEQKVKTVRVQKEDISLNGDSIYSKKFYKAASTLDVPAQYAKQNNSNISAEKVERYSSILREEFEDGFRPNRAIDLNRFKTFCAERYGTEPQDSDDRIISTLKSIGSTLDGRIYAKQNSNQKSIIQEIYAKIQQAFADGATCIYVESVMQQFGNRLASELQIYNTDALKELLIFNANGAYGSKYSYIYKYGITPDTQKDVVRCLSASALPMNYYELKSILWYIPIDKIKHVLVTTSSIVNVEYETYFYAPNLSLSTDDLGKITGLIQRELNQKNFITDIELKNLIDKYCPSVAINVNGFTVWGFRNALGYLLRDTFSFNGRIISKAGKKLNMADVFAQFAHEHESLTLDELKEFADEVNESNIYWEPVLREMVRISNILLLRNDQLIFDVDAIDAILNKMCTGKYMTIKSVNLYLHFPPMKVKWNGYLLESFVYRYSKLFCLKNVGFNAGDCCGVIVRKSSRFDNYNEVILDFLVHSDEWEDKNSVLQLLVEHGYQKRKIYKGIEQIMHEANLRKKAIKKIKD